MIEERKIKIDTGHELSVRIAGNGNPAVIIQTGWMSYSLEWMKIQEELSKHTTVLAYDRAGYGLSDEGPKPRTSLQIVKELKELLDELCLKGPFILVGHSAGGLYSKHFAMVHPQLIKSIIFVESITENNYQFEELNTPEYNEKASIKARMNSMRKFLNTNRDIHRKMLEPMADIIFHQFDDDTKRKLIEYNSDKKSIQAVLDEYDAFKESAELVRKQTKFPSVPIKVLMRDQTMAKNNAHQYGFPEREATTVEELWFRHQDDLTNLSSNSKLFNIEGADHSMHLTAPEAIIEHVKELL